jgi:hypothetical protein
MMAEDNVKIEFDATFGDEGNVLGASNFRLVGETAVIFGPILRISKCPPPPPKELKVTITVDSSTNIKVENTESVVVS